MSGSEAANAPAPTTSRRRLFVFPLRSKLILPYAVLAILVVIAGAFLFARIVASSLQDRFDQQLHDAGVLVSDGVVGVEDEQLSTLRAIAHTEGLPEAVQRDDPAAVCAIVLPLTFNAGADCVDVVSLTGQSLCAMHRRPGAGPLDYDQTPAASYASWRLVQRVAAGEVDAIGDKFADLVHTDWGDVFYIAGPVKIEERVVGVVLVGTTVDRLIQRLDTISLARVTLFDPQGRVLATSMGARDTANTGLPLDEVTVIRNDQRALVHRRPLTVGSLDYTEVFGVFEARHGHDLGVFSVALSRSLVTSAGEPLRLWLIALLGAAVLAIVFIGLFLGSRILQPIQELMQATDRVAEGDLNTEVPVRGEDEIGVLARAFNKMVLGLREREFIREVFGRLVTREVREQILGGDVKLQGESRVVTILFTDIREFTRLSEKFEPTEVVQFLNEYFTVVVEAVEAYQGTVNKFGGDSTLVIFGAPQRQVDHARRAIEAGLEIRQRLGELNVRRIARGDVPIHTGIGINTGEVIAGTIGSEQRMEYTVIGDAVNVSARIQGLTKEYQGYDILLSQATYEALGDQRERFRFQNLGQTAIRGKHEPVTIYALLDRGVEEPRLPHVPGPADQTASPGEVTDAA
jgi:class 3 adenylate cyclase